MTTVVKDSDILRAAKQRIEENKEMYICYAIRDAKVGGRGRKASLIRWVEKMLEGYTTYFSWLSSKHPGHIEEIRKTYKTTLVFQKPEFKEGRLQWLDWMIAECEKAEAA